LPFIEVNGAPVELLHIDGVGELKTEKEQILAGEPVQRRRSAAKGFLMPKLTPKIILEGTASPSRPT